MIGKIINVNEIGLSEFKIRTSEICNMVYNDYINSYITNNADVSGMYADKYS
jgi:hypothetical protein